MSTPEKSTRDLLLLGLITSGRYIIDCKGHVFDRVRNDYRAPTIDSDGHAVIHLWDSVFAPEAGPIRLARLVAIAFLGLPADSEKAVVLHRDGDRQNNAPSNLEWASRKSISRQAHKLGNIPHPVGESLPHAKLTDAQVKMIRQYLDGEMSLRKVAARFGVSRGAINAIKQGKSWRHVK